jgi:LacI family gluconate utilization system Gnt-I transcriptional repressor
MQENQQIVRLDDVARAAGVSTITASRALGNPERVSARTREHVLKVAEALGYIPNRIAASLASARTRVIGVVVPTIANPIHGTIVQSVSDVLEPAGYRLLLGSSRYHAAEELELVRAFLGHRVDGILLTGRDRAPGCLELIGRSGTPVVEMYDYNPEPFDVAVGTSNFDAGVALTQFLLNQSRRTLAFVGHSGIDDTRMTSRFNGMVAACASAGAPVPAYYEISSGPGTGAGGEIVSAILSEAPETEGIIFAGHQVAAGAIVYARDVGIAVPDRVAIAAFGDSPISRWITPTLTTMRFPLRETGMEAGRLLLARLNGTEIKTRSVRLGFEIVRGESA